MRGRRQQNSNDRQHLFSRRALAGGHAAFSVTAGAAPNQDASHTSLRKRRLIQSVRAELVEAFSNMLIHIDSISTSSMRTDLIGASLNRGARQRMQTGEHKMHVKVVEFGETKVAVLEHRGSPGLINASVQSFIEWRKEHKLSPKVSETYNIIYGDPATIAPEEFRLDICASTNSDVKENLCGVISKVIPGGRCAVLRHIGPGDNIGHSFHYLYAHWLPESGEELGDFPCFLHRVNLFPDIAEHEMITDIYLPLQ
jgi:DNA gyrase inhibitor GyrI